MPPFAVVAGVPARVLKYRFSEEYIARLIALKWWDFPDELLKKYVELFQRPLDEEILSKLEKIKSRSEKRNE